MRFDEPQAMSEQAMTPSEVLAVLDSRIKPNELLGINDSELKRVRAAVAELAQENERLRRVANEAIDFRNETVRLSQEKIDALRRRVDELEAVLRDAKEQVAMLPHSLAYEFTLIPKIDAALKEPTT